MYSAGLQILRSRFSFRPVNDSVRDQAFITVLEGEERRTKEKFKKVMDNFLFPNPAQENITITTTNLNERLSVRICDVNGKIIMERTLQFEGYEMQIKFNLMSGVYFVHLSNEQGQKSIKKLVICK